MLATNGIPFTQRRAAAGGEVGANGEFYKGGAFIATTDRPKRFSADIYKAKTGRVQVDVSLWQVPASGTMSIMDRIGGTFMGPRGNFNETYAASLVSDSVPASTIEQAREMARLFACGVRFVNVVDFPQMAALKDILRMDDFSCMADELRARFPVAASELL